MFKKKNKKNDRVVGYTDAAYPQGNWCIPEKEKVQYIEIKQTHGLNRFFMWVMKKAAKTPDVINVFKVLAHLKGVMSPYTMFFASIYKKNKIGNEETEKIILRAAWRLGCIYEYSQHRPFLEKMGYTKEQLDSYAQEDSDSWTDRERILFNAVDDLTSTHIVSDDHMAALKTIYDDDQVVQFTMLVGHYTMIAGVVNSCGVTMEDYSWLQPEQK